MGLSGAGLVFLWLALSCAHGVEIIRGRERSHGHYVCSTWGNNHYKTFDGDVYQFPGTCDYNFASDCRETYKEFSVHIQRVGGMGHPQIDNVLITIKDVTILLKSHVVIVNGAIEKTPYYSFGVLIDKNNAYIKVYAKVGLVLMWNREDAVMLELDAKFNNSTCGLCGDYNGQQLYNEFISENQQYSPITFGNLQRVNRPNYECVDPEDTQGGTTCTQHRHECEHLLTLPAFADCQTRLNLETYIEACMQDMCTCNKNQDTFCLCSTISEYSRQCSHAGGHPANWRSDQFCPKQCPKNMVYLESGSPCMNTCSHQDIRNLCEEHHMDGCFCPEGTVVDDLTGHGCVPVSKCHCKLQGILYSPGQKIVNECEDCVCNSGQWVCKNLPCPGVCSLEGGSHISTFDGKKYTFHGDCYYVFSKGVTNGSHIILGELASCGSTHRQTCLKTVILLTDNKKNMVAFQADGTVLLNEEKVAVPYVAASFSIVQPTSSNIIVQVSPDLQMQIQLKPVVQLYITMEQSARGTLQGLCGNFNSKALDDFKTASGLVEATASAFANTWKALPSCPDKPDWLDDPCSLNIESETYAEHWCSKLTNSESPFAKCHSAVDPAEYYKRCKYDTCNCKNSEDCMCAAISSYVRACASKGIVLWGWRNGICVEGSCPASQIYLYNLTTCQPTCRSLNDRSQSCDADFVPLDGCGCPSGLYMTEKGHCVVESKCSCYHKGLYLLPGNIVFRQEELCTCRAGRLHCVSMNYNDTCPTGKIYLDCSKLEPGSSVTPVQKTCQTRTSYFKTDCVSGCVCPAGLIDDGRGNCISESQCPCIHNEDFHPDGSRIRVDCNTCTCHSGHWSCTKTMCFGTCTIHGSGHYITFDGKQYNFDGHCGYVASQDYCGQKNNSDSMRIVTENVPCGTTGVTCSKAIKVFLGNLQLKLEDKKITEIQGDGENGVQYLTREVGLYLVIQASNGILLIWDTKTTIFIKLSPQFKGKVCGLCGNFDGDVNNDFTTSSQVLVTNALEFGNSWKVTADCPDVKNVILPCSVNPHRKSWAEKQCAIIKSPIFHICHNKVEPTPYYEACVHDSCSCDSGGDCECFCSAVAVYAQECTKERACVQWRTPDLCPIFCDYYNHMNICDWHYHPCGKDSLTTCRSLGGIYSNVTVTHLEGCYPTCPEDAPVFDETIGKCIPPELCGCVVDNKYYEQNQEVPTDEKCTSCICTEGPSVNCSYDEKACYCLINGTRYEEGEVIYHKIESGFCIVVICKNGTEVVKMTPCPTTSTTITTTSVTTPTTTPITPGLTSTTVPTTTCGYEYVCSWSPWFDVSTPHPGPDGGDFETYDQIRDHGHQICEAPHDIQCRSAAAPDVSLGELGQKLQCNVSFGLICRNQDQEPDESFWELCYDYEIRVNCCALVWCPSSTTPTTTKPTTTPKTTTETTTTTTTTPTTTTPITTSPTTTTTTTTPKITTETTTPSTTTPTTTTPTTTPTTTTSITTTKITTESTTYTTTTPTTTTPTTTTPTTTTESTTETTTPTTTTPTTTTGRTTTTPPIPTTSCPVVCHWTPWFDVSYPTYGADGGDFETYDKIREEGFEICEHPQNISCRSQHYPDIPIHQLGQKVHCDVSVGLTCKNSEQTEGPSLIPVCYNYEISVYCCEEICPTTPGTTTPTTTPITTTTTTTTTETTTTTPSPPTTTTEQTTTPTTTSPTTTPTTTTTTTTTTEKTTTPLPPTTTTSTTTEKTTTPTTTSTPTTTTTTTTPTPTPTITTTTTTTTGPTSTTPIPTTSCPVVCHWTPWFDVSYPEYGANGGDFETYDKIREEGHEICEHPQNISCRSQHYPDIPIHQLGQKVHCDVSVGLTCKNSEQTEGPSLIPVCYNYEISVYCCEEICPTTPGTTTPTAIPSTTTTTTTTPKTTTITPTTTTPKTTTTTPTTTTGPTSTTLTSTTICTPGIECEWTDWIDVDYPQFGPDGGDFETYDKIRENGIDICGRPENISCRAERFPDKPLEELQQKVTCDVRTGLICHNKDQSESTIIPMCYNYEIKVYCCREITCGPTTTHTTTTPGTTTTLCTTETPEPPIPISTTTTFTESTTSTKQSTTPKITTTPNITTATTTERTTTSTKLTTTPGPPEEPTTLPPITTTQITTTESSTSTQETTTPTMTTTEEPTTSKPTTTTTTMASTTSTKETTPSTSTGKTTSTPTTTSPATTTERTTTTKMSTPPTTTTEEPTSSKRPSTTSTTTIESSTTTKETPTLTITTTEEPTTSATSTTTEGFTTTVRTTTPTTTEVSTASTLTTTTATSTTTTETTVPTTTEQTTTPPPTPTEEPTTSITTTTTPSTTTESTTTTQETTTPSTTTKGPTTTTPTTTTTTKSSTTTTKTTTPITTTEAPTTTPITTIMSTTTTKETTTPATITEEPTPSEPTITTESTATTKKTTPPTTTTKEPTTSKPTTTTPTTTSESTATTRKTASPTTTITEEPTTSTVTTTTTTLSTTTTTRTTTPTTTEEPTSSEPTTTKPTTTEETTTSAATTTIPTTTTESTTTTRKTTGPTTTTTEGSTPSEPTTTKPSTTTGSTTTTKKTTPTTTTTEEPTTSKPTTTTPTTTTESTTTTRKTTSPTTTTTEEPTTSTVTTTTPTTTTLSTTTKGITTPTTTEEPTSSEPTTTKPTTTTGSTTTTRKTTPTTTTTEEPTTPTPTTTILTTTTESSTTTRKTTSATTTTTVEPTPSEPTTTKPTTTTGSTTTTKITAPTTTTTEEPTTSTPTTSTPLTTTLSTTTTKKTTTTTEESTTPAPTTTTGSTRTTTEPTTPSSTPTTICTPGIVCEWTEWIDVSYPEFTPEGGDFETYDEIRKHDIDICEAPENITCRAERFPDTPLEDLQQKVTCNVSVGLICHNKDQFAVNFMPMCYNYQISVYCCREITCGSTTTRTSTTQVTTTTPCPTETTEIWPSTPKTTTPPEVIVTSPVTTTVTVTTTEVIPTTPTEKIETLTMTTVKTTPTKGPVVLLTSTPEITSETTTETTTTTTTAPSTTETTTTVTTTTPSTTSVTTICHCLHDGKIYLPGEMIYNGSSGNWCFAAYCNDYCDITYTDWSCGSSTPATTTETTTATTTPVITTTPTATTTTTPTTTTPGITTSETMTPEITTPETTTPEMTTTPTTTTPTTTKTTTTSGTTTPETTTPEITTPTTTTTTTSGTTTPETITPEITTTTITTTPTTTTTTTTSGTTTPETTTSEITTTSTVTTTTTPTTTTPGITTSETMTPKITTPETTTPEMTTTPTTTPTTTKTTTTSGTTTPETTTSEITTPTTTTITTSGTTTPETITPEITTTTITTTPTTTTTTTTSGTTTPETTTSEITTTLTTTPTTTTTTTTTTSETTTPGTTTPEITTTATSTTSTTTTTTPRTTTPETTTPETTTPKTTTTGTTTKEATTSRTTTTPKTTTSKSTHPTTTPTTVPSTTKLPGCPFEPHREHNETWMLCNCTMARCLENNTVEIIELKCEPPPMIQCASGRPPVAVPDDDLCCWHWECDCLCTGWGDPHYKTFDGIYYSYQGNCTYVLVEEIQQTIDNFGVYIDNYHCDARDKVSCPRTIIVTHETQEVQIKSVSLAPIKVQVLVNKKMVSLPYKKYGVKIYQSGINYVVEIPKLEANITYNGLAFSIKLPYRLFGNNTQGQCGTCTNNQLDDCRSRSGEILSNCEIMADSWIVHDPNKPHCRTQPITSPPLLKTTTSPCKYSPLCDIINGRTFQKCHGAIPPKDFFQACVFDSCHVPNTNIECASLQNYALLCADQGICVDWRSQVLESCPITCPSHKVYKPCGPAVEATCQDRWRRTLGTLDSENDVKETSQIMLEGCFCPSGTMLHGAGVEVCVEKCGCVGPDKVPRQFGEIFIFDCQDCICREGGSGIVCEPHKCMKQRNIACNEEGFYPVTQINPKDPCCNETVCRCDASLCTTQHPNCGLGFDAVGTIPEGKCCPIYQCVRKNVCVHGGAEYQPNSPVFSDKCQSCVCKASVNSTSVPAVSCEHVPCNVQCEAGFTLKTDVKNECCGVCQQTHCVLKVDGVTKLLNPGETVPSQTDNCTMYSCTVIRNQFITSTSHISCPRFYEEDCVPGTVELMPNGCCKVCIEQKTACEVKQFKDYISHNNCTSSEKVTVQQCEGSCGTYSMYSARANSMAHKCTCCQELQTSERPVVLHCSDGTQVNHQYLFVEKCGCISTDCGPSSNKRARRDTHRLRRSKLNYTFP